MTVRIKPQIAAHGDGIQQTKLIRRRLVKRSRLIRNMRSTGSPNKCRPADRNRLVFQAMVLMSTSQTIAACFAFFGKTSGSAIELLVAGRHFGGWMAHRKGREKDLNSSGFFSCRDSINSLFRAEGIRRRSRIATEHNGLFSRPSHNDNEGGQDSELRDNKRRRAAWCRHRRRYRSVSS